jgi:hypothetical protein
MDCRRLGAQEFKFSVDINPEVLMRWILVLPLAAVSAGAQTYVKPYSLSVGVSQKFEHRIIGPMVTKSPYEFDDAVSVGLNYRTPRDRIKLGLAYSHTIQNGTNAVSAEIRYNVFQWGKRQVKNSQSVGP